MARVFVCHGGLGVEGGEGFLTIVEKKELRCLQKGMCGKGRVGGEGKGTMVVERVGREVGEVV
jgi:hypothetical protein